MKPTMPRAKLQLSNIQWTSPQKESLLVNLRAGILFRAHPEQDSMTPCSRAVVEETKRKRATAGRRIMFKRATADMRRIRWWGKISEYVTMVPVGQQLGNGNSGL
jgi:hypothetical protein